jgi:3-hydroxyisobutyrate dehydrogenase-like beta-hydroxyacid dehydrogenase
MIALAIETMAEAAVLAGSHGVSPASFLDLMTHTLFGGRAYETYGGKIAKGDFEPGFAMRLGLKDLGLAIEIADSAAKRLPLLQAMHSRMQEAIDAGLGDKDWSGVADYTMRL